MRRFHLHRRSDITGISGTGIVAEGIQFTDRTVVLRWLKSDWAGLARVKPTTVIHDDIESVIALHGHDGATQILWVDYNEGEPTA
jgi:hypothetical protein